jgi:hypothetical protein
MNFCFFNFIITPSNHNKKLLVVPFRLSQFYTRLILEDRVAMMQIQALDCSLHDVTKGFFL